MPLKEQLLLPEEQQQYPSLPLPHLLHTLSPPPLCQGQSQGCNGRSQAIIPNSSPTAADTKNLSALSNGVEEPMGQARMGGSQKGKSTLPELGGACPLPTPSLSTFAS